MHIIHIFTIAQAFLANLCFDMDFCNKHNKVVVPVQMFTFFNDCQRELADCIYQAQQAHMHSLQYASVYIYDPYSLSACAIHALTRWHMCVD